MPLQKVNKKTVAELILLVSRKKIIVKKKWKLLLKREAVFVVSLTLTLYRMKLL